MFFNLLKHIWAGLGRNIFSHSDTIIDLFTFFSAEASRIQKMVEKRISALQQEVQVSMAKKWTELT